MFQDVSAFLDAVLPVAFGTLIFHCRPQFGPKLHRVAWKRSLVTLLTGLIFTLS